MPALLAKQKVSPISSFWGNPIKMPTLRTDESTLRQAMDVYHQYIEIFPQGPRFDDQCFNLAAAHAELGECDPAPHYERLYRRSQDVRLRRQSRDRMCRLYLQHGRAAEGLPLFREVFNAAVVDADLRAQAAAWLVEGYLAVGEPDAILPYLSYLSGNVAARFNPAFNSALLEAGDHLMETQA